MLAPERLDLLRILAPQAVLLDDGVGQGPEGVCQAGLLLLGEAAPSQRLYPLRQVEGVACEGNFKLNLVVELRMGAQTLQIVRRQLLRQGLRQGLGQEGVEADPRIDVGQALEIHHQGEGAEVPVAVVVPLVGPDAVGDDLPVQAQGQGAGADADHLRRVPVRHDAVDRPLAAEVRVRAHGGAQLLPDQLQAAPLLLQLQQGLGEHQGPHLQ